MSTSNCHFEEKKGKKICPVCGGQKKVAGVCSCNMEWRGNKIDNQWEDCQCTPEIDCAKCKGTGYIDAELH